MAGGRVWACRIVVLIGLVIGTTGCNVIRVTLDKPITQSDVAFIVPGKTTIGDVITVLGAPTSITESSRGVVVTYRFLDLKYSRVNFGWLLRPWTPVDPDMILSRTGFGVDAYELLCDDRWVVTDQSFLRQVSNAPFTPYPF